MTKLVVCCDGTWNTPEQKEAGRPAPTNVYKISNAVVSDAGQKVYYHSGVGTEGGLWNRFSGGAMGAWLDKIIQSAYHWLCLNYQPGDEIYLFGFSRGAYTVRSLAGFIARCGLLQFTDDVDDSKWKQIEAAFQGYRSPKPGKRKALEIPIRFIGVWDTVGALGVPDDRAILNLFDNRRNYEFHDTELGKSVQKARQALALDERRASFTPTLWTNPRGQDCLQVWFPGCHSDVGGGFAASGLSDGALKWMIEEAEKTGLKFLPSMVAQVRPDFQDILHNSVVGVFAWLRVQPRAIPKIEKSTPDLDASALNRQAKPRLDQGPYRPTFSAGPGSPVTVDVFARQRWNETGIYLEAGKNYTFSAKGQWMDSGMKYDPDGRPRGLLWLGHLVHAAMDVKSLFEVAYRGITGNRNAAFRGIKREKSMPWFTLVGVIANAGPPLADVTPQPHEVFKIGRSRSYTPTKSWYLYAFANDAWDYYSNNKGSVSLTVT